MDTATFEPGDIVRLKSGGPAMVVESIESHPPAARTKGIVGDLQVRALWFDAAAARQEALFWPHVLAIDPKAKEDKEADAGRAADRAKANADEATKRRDADARAAAERSAAFNRQEPAQLRGAGAPVETLDA
jgi:uncharacterized protein YodC (DUF2158 family)